MKISPNLNNFNTPNKNINKPSFGTLYNLEEFNKFSTYLDDDSVKRLKQKIAEFEKQYPDTDCYVEVEEMKGTSTRNFNDGIFKFVEKTPEPLKVIVEKIPFIDRLFQYKSRKWAVLPKDVYSVTRTINGYSMDKFFNTYSGNTPEEVVNEMYDTITNGYKRLEHCKEIGAELEKKYPNVSKKEVVSTAQKDEQIAYDNTGSIL